MQKLLKSITDKGYIMRSEKEGGRRVFAITPLIVGFLEFDSSKTDFFDMFDAVAVKSDTEMLVV